MDCSRFVSGGIPSFEDAWKKVKDEDNWRYRLDDEINRAEQENTAPDGEEEEESYVAMIKGIAEGKVMEYAVEVYDRIVSVLEKFYMKPTTTVYRAMSVDDIHEFIASIKKTGRSMLEGKLAGVGIYWAYDHEHAIGHWATGVYDIVLVATVRCDDVDFEESVLNFMIMSSSDDEYSNENEMRLLPGRQIVIERIYEESTLGHRKEPPREESLIKKPIVAWT